MSELGESKTGVRLGHIHYEFSQPVSLLAISADSWRGAALSHVVTASPLSFLMENHPLTLMSLNHRLSRARGSGTIDIGNGFYSNLPGEVFRGEFDAPAVAISVYITTAMLEDLFDIKYSADVASANLRGIRTTAPLTYLMRALLEDVQAGSPSGPVLSESIVAAIACITHPVEIGRREVRDRRRADLPMRTLRTIREMIAANVAKPLHLQDLAAAANMSVRHFARAFRESTGLTPHQYILRARVDAARDMISSTPRSYDEVAWATGFADRNHMATVFRKIVGIPPSHFRRR